MGKGSAFNGKPSTTTHHFDNGRTYEDTCFTMKGREDDDQVMTERPDNYGQQGGGEDGHSTDLLAMLRLARDLRVLFRTMGIDLDLDHKNVNIARITGGSVATIGTLMAIGAGIAIPFTFGISTIFAIVGGAVAGAGGMTAGGAGIFKLINDKKKMKEAETKWTLFCNTYNKINNHLGNLPGNEAVANGINVATGVGAVGAVGATTLGLVARESLVAAGVGGRAAVTAARLAAATASVTVLLNVVLLGFSLYDIIDGSRQIHRDTKSEAGDIMRNLANELDDLIAGVDDNLLNSDFGYDLLSEGELRMSLFSDCE